MSDITEVSEESLKVFWESVKNNTAWTGSILNGDWDEVDFCHVDIEAIFIAAREVNENIL